MIELLALSTIVMSQVALPHVDHELSAYREGTPPPAVAGPPPTHGVDPLEAALAPYGPLYLHVDEANGVISGFANGQSVSLVRRADGVVSGFLGGRPVRLYAVAGRLTGYIGEDRVELDDFGGGGVLGSSGGGRVALHPGRAGAEGQIGERAAPLRSGGR